MATGHADASFVLLGGKSVINDCNGICTQCICFVDDIPWCTYYQRRPDSTTACTFCKAYRIIVEEK